MIWYIKQYVWHLCLIYQTYAKGCVSVLVGPSGGVDILVQFSEGAVVDNKLKVTVRSNRISR